MAGMWTCCKETWKWCVSAPREDSRYECSDEGAICRVCFDGPEEGPLFKPCRCNGTSKYIHVECLEKWRKQSAVASKKCQTCHYQYKLETVSSTPHTGLRGLVAGCLVHPIVLAMASLLACGVIVALCTLFSAITMMWLYDDEATPLSIAAMTFCVLGTLGWWMDWKSSKDDAAGGWLCGALGKCFEASGRGGSCKMCDACTRGVLVLLAVLAAIGLAVGIVKGALVVVEAVWTKHPLKPILQVMECHQAESEEEESSVVVAVPINSGGWPAVVVAPRTTARVVRRRRNQRNRRNRRNRRANR